jgi:hypothetical protein
MEVVALKISLEAGISTAWALLMADLISTMLKRL